MTRVILPLLLFICFFSTVHAQWTAQVKNDFDVADKELPEHYYHLFYDQDYTKDTYFIEAPPLNFYWGFILAAYFEIPNTDSPLPGYREISFLVMNNEGASQATHIPLLAREHVSFTVMSKIVLKVSATRVDVFESTNEPIYFPYTKYFVFLDGKFKTFQELNDIELRLVRNFVFAGYGYDFTSPELKQFFSQFPWYKPMYKNVDHLLQAEDKEVISEIQKEESGFHNYKALPVPNLSHEFTAKGKVLSPDLARFFFPQDELANDYEYTAIMPAQPVNGGFLLGLSRSRKASDSTFARAHSFVFWKSGSAGQPVVFPMDPMKYPITYPTVKILHDHFVRIQLPPGFTDRRFGVHFPDKRKTFTYGIGYLVISGNDLFKLTNTPKSEIAYHTNYLYARYGLKFDTQDLITEFSKFSWYKPLNNMNTINQKLTPDENQIRIQLNRDDW